MNGLETILEKQDEIKPDREYKVRELVRIIPHTDCGTVKSQNKEGELTGKYTVFFKNRGETKGLQEAIDNGKTVLVTIKEVDKKWFVIKKEIRTPNVKIPESSLEEQQKESEAFGDY